MTDATIAIIVAQVPATIASITAALVAFVALRKGKAIDKKADTAISKQDRLIEKAGEIHEQTNGQLGRVVAALETALNEIEELKQAIFKLKLEKETTNKPTLTVTGRILVVEDDPASAKLAVLLLRMSHLEVMSIGTAADFPGALEWKPDLVLMDLRLGNDPLAGEKLTRYLRRDHPSILVVILSADALTASQISEMGATAAIWKPIDPDTFGQTVRAYLLEAVV